MRAKLIECRGEFRTYRDWSLHINCSVQPHVIKSRIRAGKDAEAAIFTPMGGDLGGRRLAKRYLYGEDMLTVFEISELVGKSADYTRRWLRLGYDLSKGIPGAKRSGDRSSKMDAIGIPEVDLYYPLDNLIKSGTGLCGAIKRLESVV